MSEVEAILDDAELKVARILAFQEDGRGIDDEEVKDVVLATNILLGGLIYCAATGTLSPDVVARAKSIGALFQENSNGWGKKPAEEPIESVFTLSREEAMYADKNRMWRTKSVFGEELDFRYDHISQEWQWRTETYPEWNSYAGAELGYLNEAYFPLREIQGLGDES